MDQLMPGPLRLLPILIGALVMGVLAFTGVATFFAITRGGLSKHISPEFILLATLGALGVFEFIMFHAVLRPAFAKKARDTAAATDNPDARDHALAQQFVAKTIIAAALLEGWGLFGAVIVLLHAQWPAIAAPIIAVIGLALMLNVRDRFARFREMATGQRTI
jgi:hypothetical protein